MKNIILTWASNITQKTWPYYQVYFNSIRQQNIQNCDFVCLSNKLDHEFIDKIVSEYHFSIVFVKTKTQKIFTERWLAYWNYIKIRNYNLVFISDSRDVLIQDNPFSYDFDGDILLTKEGLLHKDSQFNMKDQLIFQSQFQESFSNYVNWPVINAGVAFGKSNFVRDFAFLMWTNCLSHHNCTDQAVLNFIISNLHEDHRYHISDPEINNFCLTGETVKNQMLGFNPILHEDFVCRNPNEKFTVFHQWDRTIFAESILKKFIN